MSVCRNYFLSNDNLAAAGAFLSFGKTCCCARRRYRFKYDRFPSVMAMVKCRYRACFILVAVRAITAFFTILVFCRNFCFIPFTEAMSICRYCCLCFENFSANIAMRTFRQASIYAIRSYCFVDYFCMTKCGNNFLNHCYFATARAFFTFSKTCCRTRRCYCFEYYLFPSVMVMVKRRNGGCLILITVCAIAAFFALFTLCGSLCFIPFAEAMTKCGNRCLCNESFAADVTVATLCEARFDACGCYRFVYYSCMSVCGNYLLRNNNLATTGAFLSFGKTCCRTSRCYRFEYYLFPSVMAMIKLSCGFCFVFITVSAITAFFALFTLCGSLCFVPFAEAMTKCGNRCLCNESFAADVTVATLCEARFDACGCYRFVYYSCMSVCGNYLLRNNNLATTGAFLSFGKTCCRTSRCYRFEYYLFPSVMAMIKLSCGFCFVFITVSAITAFFALFTLCGSLCFVPFAEAMTKCGNRCLCNKNFAANIAMRAFCQACCCAIGRYCFVNYFGMSNFINNYCTANVTKNRFFTRFKYMTVVFSNLNQICFFFLYDLRRLCQYLNICAIVTSVNTSIF